MPPITATRIVVGGGGGALFSDDRRRRERRARTSLPLPLEHERDHAARGVIARARLGLLVEQIVDPQHREVLLRESAARGRLDVV